MPPCLPASYLTLSSSDSPMFVSEQPSTTLEPLFSRASRTDLVNTEDQPAVKSVESRKQFRNRSAVSPQKQYVLSAAMPTLFAGLWQCQCSDFDFIRMKRNIQWISICSILASSTSSVTAGSGSDGVEMSDDTVKIFDFNTGIDEVNNWWEVSDTVR